MNILNRYKKIIISVVVIIGLGLSGYFIYFYFYTLSITSISPSLDSVSYQTPYLKINFTKDIKKDSIKITGDISNIKNKKIDKKHLTINFSNSFEVDQDIKLVVSAESLDGYRIIDKKIHFKVKNINSEDLPEDQRKALKEIEQARPAYYNDPILKAIPYDTLEYSITPNFVSGDDVEDLQIDIIVYLSNIDIKTGRDIVIDQYVNDAKKYLELKGFDIEQYSYTITVREP